MFQYPNIPMSQCPNFTFSGHSNIGTLGHWDETASYIPKFRKLTLSIPITIFMENSVRLQGFTTRKTYDLVPELIWGSVYHVITSFRTKPTLYPITEAALAILAVFYSIRQTSS